MQRLVTHSSIISMSLLIGSCASTEVADPPIIRNDPMAKCRLDRDAIETVKVYALDRLMADWPVLDRHCESFSSKIETTGDGACLIVGGPLRKEGCEDPSHYGYKVAFDPKTLETYQVYWITQ